MKNIRAEFLAEKSDPRVASSQDWLRKPYQRFDANKWTINVGQHFPELIAEEYQLLWASLPYQLCHFTEVFESSRALLELEDDWDGNGGQSFTEDHWRLVIRFIADNVAWLWQRRGMTIEAPEISPGPGQTIDVHWQTTAFEMLVNIPADVAQPAQFYGDDAVGHDLKGKLDLSRDNFWLFLWMATKT
jgi:hypothetical protein